MTENIVTERKFRSKLGPYEAEIRELKAAGVSTREIARLILERHGVTVSHNAIASFVRTHRLARRNFLDGISFSRREELLRMLKAMWTHDSTAIEGNTLTLGDTLVVLQYGLTVKGKPLKDHDDLRAHAHGVEFVAKAVDRGRIAVQDVKDLHRIVVAREVMDIYKPIGEWKREDNGTYNSEGGRPVYMPYAPAADTPRLMDAWVDDFNRLFDARAGKDAAIDAYVRAHVSFVRIHPFYDGNGRLARLLANMPVLFAGHPPIVVPSEARAEYINALWTYQRTVGPVSSRQPDLLPSTELLAPLRDLVRSWWKSTLDLVAEAKR